MTELEIQQSVTSLKIKKKLKKSEKTKRTSVGVAMACIQKQRFNYFEGYKFSSEPLL